MKNIVLVLLLSCPLILLTNYCVYTNATQGVDNVSVHDAGIFINDVSDSEFNLEDTRGVPSKGLIISAGLALDIANAVIRAVYSENVILETEFIVREIKDKDIFVVSRMPKDGRTLVGDYHVATSKVVYHVAISKVDGRILKVWAEE